MMKNYSVLLLLLLLFIVLDSQSMMITGNHHEVHARSFMFTRPAYAHLYMQQQLWHDIVHNKPTPSFGAVQAEFFVQRSVPLSKTARYFLPFCKNELMVAGDATSQDVRDSRDIRAEWIGLAPEFQGSFSIRPEQKQYGCLVEYSQDLKNFFDIEFLKHYWVSISLPLVAVENNIHITQQLLNAPVPANAQLPKDIIEAFNQVAWGFGKINGKSKRVRLAEVRLMLGSALVSKDYFQMAYHTIFVAPAGNRANGHHMFEAVAGNNQHVGLGGAIFFQFPVNRDITGYGNCFFANLESIFLVRNEQFRTFDLRDKPWSRYMLYNEKNGRQNIPGVNILTRQAVVRPYGTFDFSTGWRLKNDWLELEIGYNLWGKSNETVELRTPFRNACDCFGQFGIAGTGFNSTARESTVGQQAGNDPFFIPVLQTEIDLLSAESGSVLNHTFHVAFGAKKTRDAYVGFIGGNVFVDFPQKNSSLKTWGACIKMGGTY